MKHLRRLLDLRIRAESAAAQSPELTLIAQRIAAQILNGPRATKKAGSGESFWQYRDYMHGDMPSHIDWRQSAKTDSVFIRQKEQQKAQSHYFWIKRDSDMRFASRPDLLTKQQAACVLSLALSLLLTRSGDLFGFLGAMRAGHSERSLETLEALALEDNPKAAPEGTLDIPRHAGLFLLSDFLEPPETIHGMIASLSQRTNHIHLIQILDPAEIDFPYKGRIIFQSPSASQKIHFSNASDIAEAYQHKMRAHCTQLEALAKECGASYSLYNTAHDPAEFLKSFWLQTSGAWGRS